METFTAAKNFIENSEYHNQRTKSLSELPSAVIDAPITRVVGALNALSCCFSLQCCYGHFLYPGQEDPNNLDPLPGAGAVSEVKYRIAYVALCIENSASGKKLFDALKEIPAIDPNNVQFGSADWFWERQVNSYALQVEPDRFKYQDTALLDYDEALLIEKVRNEFFQRLEMLLRSRINNTGKSL